MPEQASSGRTPHSAPGRSSSRAPSPAWRRGSSSIGIMSALPRERTKQGQHVEVSLLQGVMSLTTQIWNWTDQGSTCLRRPSRPASTRHPSTSVPTGSGINAATTAGITPTKSEGSILGIEDLTMAEVFGLGPEQRAAYEEAKRAAFVKHDRDELVEEYHQAGLGAEAIVAPHERFTHPQLVATGSVVQVDDPDIGPTTQLGMTIFLEGTPGRVKGPRPRPGADNDEVLGRGGLQRGRRCGDFAIGG